MSKSNKVNKKPSKQSIGFPAKRSPSLESTQSIGDGTPVKSGYEEVSLSPLAGIPAELFGEATYDCCAFIIYCAKHNKIAVTRGRASWLPFVALKSVDSWKTEALGGCAFILSHGDVNKLNGMPILPFLTPELVEIFRIQVPHQPKFTSRLMYAVRVNNEVKDFKCCRNDKKVEWIDRNDIKHGHLNLWGPEPYLFADIATKDIKKRTILEYSIDDALSHRPREPPRGKEEEMLKSAGIGEREIIKIYQDFVEHCFPSSNMVLFSFTTFLLKIGWNKEDLRTGNIFRAFNYNGTGHITFYEFLLGLAAIDQGTHHGGESGVVRCGYIFRYYDIDNDGCLVYEDIKRMAADIFVAKQIQASEQEIDKDATHRMVTILKKKKTDKVQFATLMEAVLNLTFRGTSVLFRSNIKFIENIVGSAAMKKTDGGSAHPVTTKRQYRGTCMPCKSKIYRISTFTVRLDYTGRVVSPKNLRETDKNDIKWSADDEHYRQFAVETLFNPSSLPNNILDILRQFDSIQKKRINATSPTKKEWGKQDRNYILSSVQAICKKAEEIFEKESRCVKVSSPVYVFGDIHGNIADLLTYERNIWRTAPAVTACNYLFLGDYVDRGESGVEVVCYLFALKILAPERFFLCRGNHEIRSIQKCFTFFKECNIRYGTRVGPQVFEACNRAFDRMPICAVIDETIFGAHGGIPTSLIKIEDLMKIPTPLQEPENESPAAWEIMWNDPMNSSEFNELADFMKVDKDKVHGFLSNSKRGTAFYYSEEAVDNFMAVNGLQYILRGHEVMPTGYKFHMNGKVMTIFSSSRYCGGTNEAAALFVDNEEIRVLKFETHGELRE